MIFKELKGVNLASLLLILPTSHKSPSTNLTSQQLLLTSQLLSHTSQLLLHTNKKLLYTSPPLPFPSQQHLSRRLFCLLKYKKKLPSKLLQLPHSKTSMVL